MLSAMQNMDVQASINSLSHLSLQEQFEQVCALALTQERINTTLEEKLLEQSAQIEALTQAVQELTRQIYGQKSERRQKKSDEPVDPTLPKQNNRGTAPTQRKPNHTNATGLRFDETTPRITIKVKAPEGADLEVIRLDRIYRLAQRPAAVVILEYEIPVVKQKETGQLVPLWQANPLFEGSYADVSFIAGLLIDKCLYHLPLYRQHQRLLHAGVDIARSTLTNWFSRAADLLKPLYNALQASILRSDRLQMDETPIKASRKIKGKMHTGYFWPMLGDQSEIVFVYANTRAKSHIEKTFANNFKGILLTDGYGAYQSYCKGYDDIIAANCIVHWRRLFEKIKDDFPDETNYVLDAIGKLYSNESQIKELKLSSQKKLDYRTQHSKPIVDELFAWCDQQLLNQKLTPKNKLRAAIQYGTKRENALKVFLEDPDLPLDTNEIEGQIRAVALGKKNWMFAWTESGAEQLGIIYSLIASCRLQNVDPYTYLVDVLLRVSDHSAKDVEQLIPRHWKEHFQESPRRSDLWGLGQ